MTDARLRPMPDADLAGWRTAQADADTPLPDGDLDALAVEVDGVRAGGVLLEYVEERCFVRTLQTTLPPGAASAWAAVLDALDRHARDRGARVLSTAVAPELAEAFGAAGFRATMTTVGKRLTTSPFAPELQVDRRVVVRPMTDEERHLLAAEGLDALLPGMERAGVADRGSVRLGDLAERLARLGRDPAPDDELLLTALVDGVPVGRLWATTLRRDDALDVFGNLLELLPEHRGQGLTKSFLGAIRRHLHELGVRDLRLRVLGHDAGAGRTFRRAGYTVTDVHLRKELV